MISFYMVNKWWPRFCLVYNMPWYWVKDLGKYRGTFLIKIKDCRLCYALREQMKQKQNRVHVKVLSGFEGGQHQFFRNMLKKFAWICHTSKRTLVCTVRWCSLACSLLWIILISDSKSPPVPRRPSTKETQYQGMLYFKQNQPHYLFTA